ncbi:MAG: glutamate mutase L [Anaerolineae bacterium]|jgi:hypothetical protein|nr:glutamate mutase L [Anaerolineae bacterium]
MSDHTTSILILDIGTSITTAILLQHFEDLYRLVGVGTSTSTMNAPAYDVWLGCVAAIQEIEAQTERVLLTGDEQIIKPLNTRGEGVDYVVMTTSAGPELKIVAAGLLEDVSVQSCRRLAGSVGGRLVDEITLAKGSAVDVHLDRALQHRPEIVVMAGGTEGGASRAVMRTAELIRSVCQLLPDEKRPAVLFAGNQGIKSQVEEMLNPFTQVISVSNIRPTMEKEDLSAAQYSLAEILGYIRTKQVGGLEAAAQNSVVPLLPTGFTFGRALRYISTTTVKERNPVLGISMDTDQTVFADALRGNVRLNVMPFGIGQGIERLMYHVTVNDIIRWVPADIPFVMVRDYLEQKKIYPNTIPMDEESLLIEQALTRIILQLSLSRTRQLFDKHNNSFTEIVAAGYHLTAGPTMMHTLYLLLDGLQPNGITRVKLDPNQLLSAMGAASAVDSAVPVHLLASDLFPQLGTVISPFSDARFGEAILHARISFAEGDPLELEVNKGEIKVIPLEPGQQAHVVLTGFPHTWITERPPRTRVELDVTGGLCGLVIDGRGRPIYLPRDNDERIQLLKIWRNQLGIGNAVSLGVL